MTNSRLSKLPRSLFGYQRSEVDRMLAERDAMLGAADSRVRTAEARVAQLEDQVHQMEERLAPLQDQLERRDGEVESLRADIDSQRTEIEERFAERETGLRARLDQLQEELREKEEALAARGAELEELSEDGGHAEDGGRIVELEEQLRGRDLDLEAVRGEAEALRAAIEAMHEERAAAEADEQPGMTSEFMTEELSRVVAAAEESATRIIERAWSSTRQQITDADRLWREVQAEIIHFGNWRQHVEPKIEAVLGTIEQAKGRIEEISERIQDALRPAVEAISSVETAMTDFASASNTPLLLAPSGLEAARARARSDRAPTLTAVQGQNDEDGGSAGGTADIEPSLGADGGEQLSDHQPPEEDLPGALMEG